MNLKGIVSMKNALYASIAAVLLMIGNPSVGIAETTAYIANSGADEVLRITDEDEAVTTTPATGSPYGIAVTPDGRQVLVTREEADDVAFIDTSNFSGTPFSLTVGDAPRGVAIDPTGQYAYVANFNDDTVSRISIAGRDVAAIISVGEGPWGVAVRFDEQNDAHVAYVANHLDDSVTVIDKDDQTSVIHVGGGPTGVAVTPDGLVVYVANTDDDTVSVIDTVTGTVIDTVTVGDAPWGVAVGADGEFAYVTNSGADTVTVIRVANHSVADTYAVGDAPSGVAAPRNGRFAYVVNQNDGSISRIDMDEETVTELAVGSLDDAHSMGAFIGDAPPSPPSGLEAEVQSETRVELNWIDNSTGEWGFKIERSQRNEDNYTQIATVGENSTTYEDFRLSSDTVYFYRIRSYNEAADSTYSTSAEATTDRYTGSIWCFINSLIDKP
jgi:YVTN family beta-propeller protein